MYKEVKRESTLDNAGSKAPDSSGVQYGLSSLKTVDSKEGGLDQAMEHDSVSGNYKCPITVNPGVTSGSAKGKKFTIC